MPNPFVGPRPLTKSNPIFGRNREITELRHLLISERLVLLHSPSGAGKSSLVNAGLIPELEDHFDVWEPTRVNSEPPPEITSNRYVWSTIYNWKKEGDETTLVEFVHAHPSRKNPLLIFDQFEEILRVNPTDTTNQNEFFRQLAALLADPRIWALIVIREDYLAPLLPFFAQLPTHLRARYRLDLLTRESARSAIEETARTAARGFRGTALATLVENLAAIKVQNPDGSYAAQPVIGSYVEPMQLQVVCRRLWDAMPESDRDIDPEDVFAFGDVTQALGAYYDSAVASLCNGHRPSERLVREWFQEKLITSAQIRGQVQKGPEKSEGLWNTVIEQLLDKHLVRAEKRRGFTWYELAHDRLIEPVVASNLAWFEKNLYEVEKRAIVWKRQGEPERLLLYGADLQAALQWANENAATIMPGEIEFLESSNRLRIVEEERRKVAEATRQAAEQNTRKRRWFTAAIVLSPLALLGTVVILGISSLIWMSYTSGKNRDPRHGISTGARWDTPYQQEAREVRRDAREEVVLSPLAQYANALRLDEEFYGTRLAVADLLLRSSRWLPTGKQFAHKQPVVRVAFSPDGRRLVTASYDNTAQVWDVESGKAIGKPMAHKDWVMAAAFHPNGRQVVTASRDKTARIWNLETGEAIGKPLVHKGQVNTAAFSPDGSRVVTASTDSTAQVWDAASGEPIGAPLVHSGNVTCAAFSPDGKRIVTASWNNTAQLWNAGTGWAMGKPLVHEAAVNSAAFSPDGTRIVTASSDRFARIWDVDHGEGKLALPHKGEVRSAVFSADGLRVVTASEDNAAHVWDAASGEAIGVPLEQAQEVFWAAFHPDGSRLVTASRNNRAQVWRLAPVAAMTPGPLVHAAAVRSASFSDNGRRVVTVSAGNTAQVWDAGNGKPIGKALEHKGAVNSAVLSADGERVVTASDDHTAQIWNAASGEPAGAPLLHDGPVKSAAFSTDGTRVVTASEDKTARIWNAAGGEAIGKPMTHPEAVRSAMFSADGLRVLTATFGRTAQVWDANNQQPLGNPLEHGSRINSAAFSGDGNRIVTASADRTAQIWDAESGERKGPALQHKAQVVDAVFSGDSLRVVTYSWDNTVRIWDGKTGAAIGRPLLHQHPVKSVAITADGRYVATASTDGKTRIWDTGKGEALGRPLAHDAAVNRVAFSPDGQRAITASEDKTARIWDLLIDSGTPAERDLLATFAEAVDGFTVGENNTVIAMEDQHAQLREVLAAAKKLPDTPGTLAHFIRRFLPE